MTKKRSWMRIVTLVALLLIVYFVLEFIVVQNEIAKKEKEAEIIDTQIEKQIVANEELKRYLDAQDEKEYMERLAREKYDYAYPGEQVFYDTTVE